MLTPKRLKYRRQFSPKIGKVSFRGNVLSFGEYGLRAEQAGFLSSKQIEAARRAITHYIKRGGRVWIRVFPDRPITKKPPETRMGGGKGELYEYVVPIGVGRVIFEMGGVPEEIARQALKLAAYKLSVKSSFLKKRE